MFHFSQIRNTIDSGLLLKVTYCFLSLVQREVAMIPAQLGSPLTAADYRSDEPFNVVTVSRFLWLVGFHLVLRIKCYFRLGSVF